MECSFGALSRRRCCAGRRWAAGRMFGCLGRVSCTEGETQQEVKTRPIIAAALSRRSWGSGVRAPLVSLSACKVHHCRPARPSLVAVTAEPTPTLARLGGWCHPTRNNTKHRNPTA